MAEGRTTGGFVEDVRVTNPHAVDAPIVFTFIQPDGLVRNQSDMVPAGRRRSIQLNQFPGAAARKCPRS